MKKFLLFSLIALLVSCVDYTDDINAIDERLDALEQSVPSIDEQIAAIQTSIKALKEVDESLDESIKALEANDEATAEEIAALQDADAAIEAKIEELKKYVDDAIKSTKDWVSATFATLEQLNALSSEVAALKSFVDANKTEAAANLATAITNLETSLKAWVGEQLSNYYTIAEMDAKIANLEKAIADGDSALQQQLNDLKSQLETAKAELTEAYKKAIKEAIETNNGVIDEKIAAKIAIVNERITVLENRLNTLEERISAVEDAIEQIKALDITFDNADNLACKVGASVEVSYTITGGDTQTTIEAWGDGGWSADVIAESTTAGKVKVTAPSEISKRGKVVVLATSGAGGVAMKTLYFDKGILTDILDTYEVDWEACTLKVTLKTNLNYIVSIPTEAQSWIAVADTRATLRTETLTFTIAENPEDMPVRSATINLISECGDVLQSFEIIQNYQPSSAPIEFADANVKKVCVEKFDLNGDGELSYMEASKVKTLPYHFFGDYATAVTSFDELQYFVRLISIEGFAFYDCSSLINIKIPNSVTSIGQASFYGCENLVDIVIPEKVSSIERATFLACNNLVSVTIPDSVTSIGTEAFGYCHKLNDINIPHSIISIGSIAFRGCAIEDIAIPEGVTVIRNLTFYECETLLNVVIPKSVISIEEQAFYACSNLTTVCCKATTPPLLGKDVFKHNAYTGNGYESVNVGCKIYVPRNSVEAYKAADGWSDYAAYIEGYDF